MSRCSLTLGRMKLGRSPSSARRTPPMSRPSLTGRRPPPRSLRVGMSRLEPASREEGEDRRRTRDFRRAPSLAASCRRFASYRRRPRARSHASREDGGCRAEWGFDSGLGRSVGWCAGSI
jgi:hypothetical protein